MKKIATAGLRHSITYIKMLDLKNQHEAPIAALRAQVQTKIPPNLIFVTSILYLNNILIARILSMVIITRVVKIGRYIVTSIALIIHIV